MVFAVAACATVAFCLMYAVRLFLLRKAGPVRWVSCRRRVHFFSGSLLSRSDGYYTVLGVWFCPDIRVGHYSGAF